MITIFNGEGHIRAYCEVITASFPVANIGSHLWIILIYNGLFSLIYLHIQKKKVNFSDGL